MYTNSYSSYKSGRIPSSSGSGMPSSSTPSSYVGSKYSLRSSSSVPYGLTSSPSSSSGSSYSLPFSSSTLSALALSSSSRYVPSKSSLAYSPSSSASSSPRMTSLYGTSRHDTTGSMSGGGGHHHHHPGLTYSRSFNRGSDYGSWSSLSDRGSRQVSRPSSLGSSISDIRDAEPAGTGASTPSSGHHHQPTTPISAHPVAAAAAALASGAITPNGDIDYKKLWEESQVENERLRDRLRVTHEDLAKCKDQLDNAFQVSNARNAMTEAEKRERRALERKLSEMEEELKESHKAVEMLRSDISKMRDENGALIRVISKLSK